MRPIPAPRATQQVRKPQRPRAGWGQNHIERRGKWNQKRGRNRSREEYEDYNPEDYEDYEEVEAPRARPNRKRPGNRPAPPRVPAPPAPAPRQTPSPLGSFAGMFGSGLPGLGSATGPTVYPGQSLQTGNGGDEEDLGLLGLIQKGLQSAQAIKQGGPKGNQAIQSTATQLLQTFTGFNMDNLNGNFGNLFSG